MDAISRAVLTFLMNSLWQITLVVAAAALADFGLRRVPARYRHALWMTALAMAVVLPDVSLRSVKTVKNSDAPPVGVQASSGPVIPLTTTAKPVSHATPAGARRPGPAFEWNALFGGAHYGLRVSRPVARAVLILYAAFLAFMALRFLWAWLRTRQVRGLASTEPLPAHVALAIERCRRAMAIHRRSRRLLAPRVLWSGQVPGPVTVGARRAAIVLPASLLREDAQEDLAAALAHEMAHVYRRDYLWNIICELLLLPVAFHPLTRLVKRRLSATREIACDELAATLLDSSRYARSLVRMANQISLRTSAVNFDYTLGVFDANILEERVMRLMKPAPSARLAKLSLILGTLLIASSGLLAARFSLGVATPIAARGAAPQSQAANGQELAASFTGVWRAEFQSQQFVLLRLTVQGEQLAGAISTGDVNLDPDGNVTEVTHAIRSAVPILDARVEGGVLSFKQQDGSDTLSYEMRLVGGDQAQLQMLSTGPVKVRPFTLRRDGDSRAKIAGAVTTVIAGKLAEYHGRQYALAGGVSGGAPGTISGVVAGVPGGVPGGVSGGVTGTVAGGIASTPGTVPAAKTGSESETGSLSGVVVDASGARIPQADVLLVSRDTDFRHQIESDDTGGFSFDDVPAGRYTLQVISKGMGGSFRNFTLNPAGAAPFFPFVLQPGEVAESAVVTATAPPGVAAGSTAVAGVGPRKVRVGGNVEAAKLIERTFPVYPESARSAGLQGLVILEADITPEGVPTDLKVISSPGDDLGKAAVDAVQKWRYKPTLLNGNPVEVVTTISVDFRLQD